MAKTQATTPSQPVERSFEPQAQIALFGWESQSSEIDKISPALIKFQREINAVPKDRKGFNFKYASLPGLVEHVRETLGANDLGFKQEILGHPVLDKIYIVTTILHTSGQWFRDRAPLFLPQRGEAGIKDYNQAYGSAVTYLKRYSLQSMLGVVVDDEDYDAKR